jgi:hypothetical protein
MHAAAAEDEALGDGDTMAEAEALADGDAAAEAGAADADADGDAGAEADDVATEAEEAPLPEHAPSTITETSNSARSATLRTIRKSLPLSTSVESAHPRIRAPCSDVQATVDRVARPMQRPGLTSGERRAQLLGGPSTSAWSISTTLKIVGNRA